MPAHVNHIAHVSSINKKKPAQRDWRAVLCCQSKTSTFFHATLVFLSKI